MILPMKVRVLLFAALRDLTGASELSFDVAEGASPVDVWERLRSMHVALAPFADPPMVAINEEYATPRHALKDGDEIAFIPPVAGG